MAGQIHLQKSKTKGGVRTVPLSADALESAKELVVRAQSFGAREPEHYLIPALVNSVVEASKGTTVPGGQAAGGTAGGQRGAD